MLTMTPAIREHLVKSFGMKADATDDDAQKLAATKFAAGELTNDTLKSLTSAGAANKAAELADTIASKTAEAVSGALSGPLGAIAEALKGRTAPEVKAEETKTVSQEDKILEFQKTMKSWEEKLDGLAAKQLEMADGGKPFDILKLGAGLPKEDSPDGVRIKSVVERYSTHTTKAFRNCKTTHPEHRIIRRHGSHGDQLDMPTELSKALGAVWFKFSVGGLKWMTENDMAILKYILHKEKFIIHGHDPDNGTVDPSQVKPARLLDAKEIHDMLTKATVVIADNTSGGNYATPEFFDTNFILLPILGGELAPLCNIVDVPRGTGAQGFTMGNPSWTSGSTEGTAVTAFTTDSFLGNHDFTFFRAAGAIKFGLNFLEDATPGVLDATMGRIMAKAAEWLDEQVAIGDGSTEPEGIFTASGTSNVTIATATTGPYVLADFTELLFALSKAYRYAFDRSKLAFVMTDQTYYLVRSIATGVTGDTRLIFGMDIEDYRLFNHPVAIVGTGLTNDQFAFMQCGGYRLYRRQGPKFRQTAEGITNYLANQMVLAYDMRYGGGLDRGGYAAVETSGIV